MSELDEKLNALLSDPDSMAQVMQLAQQLSGSLGGDPSSSKQDPPSSSPNELDPKLLTKLMGLLQNQSSSQTTQLLHALQPFLKEEKQNKLARAAKMAHIITLGKQFLSDWEV